MGVGADGGGVIQRAGPHGDHRDLVVAIAHPDVGHAICAGVQFAARAAAARHDRHPRFAVDLKVLLCQNHVHDKPAARRPLAIGTMAGLREQRRARDAVGDLATGAASGLSHRVSPN